MRHASWCAENGEVASNERLEFLGDAVVELAVRAELFRCEPGRPEGELSKLRRSVVNTYALARAAERAQLGEALRLGRGEDRTGGRTKPTLLCNVLEAVVGATFLDAGWDVASEVVLRLVDHELVAARAAGPDGDDPKTTLQELAARRRCEPPVYVVVDEGPEHEKWFRATVSISGADGTTLVVGNGGGPSKKGAEQSAARDALRTLESAGNEAARSGVRQPTTEGMGARHA